MKTTLLDISNKHLNDLAAIVLQTAEEHGFVESVCNIDRKLLLTAGELVEAQNELRNGHAVDEIYYEHDDTNSTGFSRDNHKPEGFPIELADAIIRILDLAAELKLDIMEAVRLKAVYNDTRPYKHGKAF